MKIFKSRSWDGLELMFYASKFQNILNLDFKFVLKSMNVFNILRQEININVYHSENGSPSIVGANLMLQKCPRWYHYIII